MAHQLKPLPNDEFVAICARLDAGGGGRDDLKAATKHLLALLTRKAPGNSVEVRILPFAAVQCLAGARHTRGTPPAVVEMTAETWVSVARGRLAWGDAKISASGERSDLSPLMPLV
ncbi:MAG: sterol carrier family protein [Aeromicrobium sp.]